MINNKVMSVATPNYAPYRACLTIVNNARVVSHIDIRPRHEANSIGRVIRGGKGHDLIIYCIRKKYFKRLRYS